jgi:histidinol phosphatase-like PHP family hydrolase
MYFHEPTYDLDILCRQNLHIHSSFSGCAKPEMTLNDIVRTAELDSLEMIAITDHVQAATEDEFRVSLSKRKEQAKTIESPVRVLIGAELSAYGVNNFNYPNNDIELDYRLWAQNHYHVSTWIQPEDTSPVGYKNHIIETLTNLIKSDRADCIAHPFHDEYLTNSKRLNVGFAKGSVPSCFSDNEIGDLLTLGREQETAFELNLNAMAGYPEFCRRMYNIGREVGVYFNIGTDAHSLDRIDTKQFIERTKNFLL